jgi:hypothetical protein
MYFGGSMYDVQKIISTDSTRFMDRFRLFIRSRHYSYRTEKTYCYWVSFFIRFHHYQHPEEMSNGEIEDFLQHLSATRQVTSNTQKVALNVIIFMYREFMKIEIKGLKYKYATKPRQLPTVFTHSEANVVIDDLSGIYKLCGKLMYGCGVIPTSPINCPILLVKSNYFRVESFVKGIPFTATFALN